MSKNSAEMHRLYHFRSRYVIERPGAKVHFVEDALNATNQQCLDCIKHAVALIFRMNERRRLVAVTL